MNRTFQSYGNFVYIWSSISNVALNGRIEELPLFREILNSGCRIEENLIFGCFFGESVVMVLDYSSGSVFFLCDDEVGL